MSNTIHPRVGVATSVEMTKVEPAMNQSVHKVAGKAHLLANVITGKTAPMGKMTAVDSANIPTSDFKMHQPNITHIKM